MKAMIPRIIKLNNFGVVQKRYNYREDPDKRLENYLRGRGEFSVEASIAFDNKFKERLKARVLC